MINDYSSSFGLQMGIGRKQSQLNHCKSYSTLIKQTKNNNELKAVPLPARPKSRLQ
jgi:hypothetical protein